MDTLLFFVMLTFAAAFVLIGIRLDSFGAMKRLLRDAFGPSEREGGDDDE